MKSKIFKVLAYTFILMLAIHGYASSQDVSPDKEKEMEAKMAKMEARLKAMQQKLDSLKTNDGHLNAIIVQGFGNKQLKTFKAPPTPPAKPLQVMPPMIVASGGSINQSYSSSNSAFSGGGAIVAVATTNGITKLNYDSGKNPEEKIKSGEIKEKVKIYSKSYPVNSDDKLQINNSFGKVTINTWNKNEFKVDIEMKGIANDDDNAQKLLDGISITDSKDNGVILFTTKIESQNRSWGSWNNNGKSYVSKAEVNYTVYMPAKNSLEIKNRFGAVTLPDFKGKLIVNTQYGSFTAKELTNTENEICTLFTDVNIGSITGSTLNCQYGNGGNGVKIGSANNLKFDAQFISSDIVKLKTAANITNRYGEGIKINDIDKNLKSLNISSAFAPVAVELKSSDNFDFDVTVKNNSNGFKYNDDVVKITCKTPANDEHRWSATKNYKGHVGKGNSDAKVTITTTYKTVQFF
ncbi:hypothetical protein BDD43_1852 [Mucilaginibacter gracilis]|uniref:Adhesin n=1 Tax=Mucilaginibacter gracilis TaxID=423350 RepID=A0A495IYQ5_9SPHI|nr:hypothetical protein [Mucilaginibacter gracilis]RKR81702.1 hypothetical protein BDD43_1852 [Mucilaginibacter gracilis]